MLKSFLKKGNLEEYPFTCNLITNFNRLDFESNITILVGQNGSGKSTLLELIATKLNLPKISDDSMYDDFEFNAFKEASDCFSTIGVINKGFFFRSEDFIKYVAYVKRIINEEEQELKNIEKEYINKSKFSYLQRRSPHTRNLNDLLSMYKSDLLEQSHAESFLDFFNSRLKEKFLYILDEVEAPLSFTSSLSLLMLILEYTNKGCQFIIATHSPILMSLPN